jgi:hypothetical protein
MYAVVGCSECAALWVVEGRPGTSQCPRCGTRRNHDRRRRFLTTDDEDHAREARAAMLADRQDRGDAFDDLPSFAALERRIDEAGPSDETYLAGSGVDPEAVAAAADRATEGAGGNRSRQETVRDALRELDEPAEEAVVAYADERGVPESYTRRALRKLVRAGEVTETRGTYRLVQ